MGKLDQRQFNCLGLLKRGKLSLQIQQRVNFCIKYFMKGSTSLEESFMAKTCFYHPGIIIEAVCVEERCSSDQLLCRQCIRKFHLNHDILSLQKYKKIILESKTQNHKLLQWKWEKNNYSKMRDKDKKLLIEFKDKMDSVWQKFQDAFTIVEHAGDLKTVRKTMKVTSEKIEQYIDDKIQSVLQRARDYKENKVILLSDSSEQQQETDKHELKKSKKMKKKEKEKQKEKQKRRQFDADEIMKQIERQQQKVAKERGDSRQEAPKIAKKMGKLEDKIQKSQQSVSKPRQYKKRQDIKANKKQTTSNKQNQGQQPLKIVRTRKDSDSLPYFSIIDHTKQRQKGRKLLTSIKIPQRYEVQEGEAATEQLKKWYEQNYNDDQCRIFAHRQTQQREREYFIYFAGEFNWVKRGAIRESDFQNQMFLYERTISRRKDMEKWKK